MINDRPRYSLAQYQQQREAIQKAAPTKLPSSRIPKPNYITQDDKEELANLLFNVAPPKINTAIKVNVDDTELHQANFLHAKLYRDSLPKTQVHSPHTPLGITSQAVIHLMRAHLENEHRHCFISDSFKNFTPSLAHDCQFAEHVANGVVHPVTKEKRNNNQI